MVRLFSLRGKRLTRKRVLALFLFKPLRWIRLVTVYFLALTIIVTLGYGVVPPPLTPLMVLRSAGQITQGRSFRLDKDWRSLDHISPNLARAVLASEDQLFFDHRGFDYQSIRDAFAVNIRGRRKLGASTISQQTAKNLFLWPERSWLRKALEAYFTLLMETLWSKRRILEVYLNVIETGEGTYGAEAAARRYFGVSAAEMNPNQAALLAAILPNPRSWSPDRPTAYLLRRQEWIMRQMRYVRYP